MLPSSISYYTVRVFPFRKNVQWPQKILIYGIKSQANSDLINNVSIFSFLKDIETAMRVAHFGICFHKESWIMNDVIWTSNIDHLNVMTANRMIKKALQCQKCHIQLGHRGLECHGGTEIYRHISIISELLEAYTHPDIISSCLDISKNQWSNHVSTFNYFKNTSCVYRLNPLQRYFNTKMLKGGKNN